MEVELAEPVQINIYQSNTYRKDLSWFHFDNEPTTIESVFVAYLIFPSSS